MPKLVSVAIPVRNGADVLEQTLAAVRAQLLDPPGSIELLVCDSASQDASVSIARAYGAEVIEIPVECFSHGGTRNLLMRHAQGEQWRSSPGCGPGRSGGWRDCSRASGSPRRLDWCTAPTSPGTARRRWWRGN